MLKADIAESSNALVTAHEPKLQSRRGNDRTLAVYRLVKVEHEADQGLARCRNISDGGMKLHLSIPLNLNDRITITMSSAELNGRVVWLNGSECGIAFEEPVDCARLLNGATENGAAPATRGPRLTTNLHAKIAYEGGACEALVNDISVRGMKIANDGNFQPGLKVRVILDNGFEKEGVVRWSRDNIAGVLLLEPFDVEELG